MQIKFASTNRVAAAVVVVASVLAGLAVSLLTDHGVRVNNDTAQHLSVAHNLLNGNGLATSILYYEEQISHGVMPAPQTVWPPGYPSSIAMLGMLGIDLVLAAHAILVIAFVVSPLALFWVAIRSGGGTGLATAITLLWLLAWPAYYGVLWYETESLLIACTLGSLAALQIADHKQRAMRWFVLAGVLGACAFLMRYVGIAWLAALGVVGIHRWLRLRDSRSLLEASVLTGPGAVAVAVLIGRNLVLAGSLTGGATVQFEASAVDLIKSIASQIRLLLGAPGGGVWSDLSVIAFAAVVALALVPLAAGVRSATIARGRGGTMPQDWEVAAAAYLMLGLALPAYVASQRHVDLFSFRYLTPVVPFLLLLGAIQWRRFVSMLGARGAGLRRLVLAAGGMLGGIVAYGQLSVGSEWLNRYHAAQRPAVLAETLETPIASGTLKELLEAELGETDPLLAPDAQLLGFLLRRPTVSLPAALHTKRRWTEPEVLNLVRTYGLRYVLFYPTLFDPSEIYDRNRIFFSTLSDGEVPDWLEPRIIAERVHVYRVRPERIPTLASGGS